jgi:flagella basal body P-ring formation protein FlgA
MPTSSAFAQRSGVSEREIEAHQRLSAAAARLGAVTLSGGDVRGATRRYLLAVEAAKAIVSARYLLEGREVGRASLRE